MKCKIDGCELLTVGNSKYCREHKTEARKRWLSMVSEQSEKRAARESSFQALWSKADLAGKAAADGCAPVPMVVVEHEDPTDDNSPIVKRYAPVMGGVCGFAWIHIAPGNCPFARFARKHLGAGKDYYGGLNVRVKGYGQSYAIKMAYAGACADVLHFGLGKMGESGSVSARGRVD